LECEEEQKVGYLRLWIKNKALEVGPNLTKIALQLINFKGIKAFEKGYRQE